MSTVVVGLDGSDNSRKALAWAVEEARAHDSRLEVVHAFVDLQRVLPYTMEETGGRFDTDRTRVAAEGMVARMLDDTGVPGDLEVATVVEQGAAADALIERSKDAVLLVVGTRGHSGLSEILLGSVSNHVVHRAHCPVVVVRSG